MKSPRSFPAPWLSLEDPEMMRARLRDYPRKLTKAERYHLAKTWGPIKRVRGRPPQAAMVKRGRARAVAYTFIKLMEQGTNRKKAIDETKRLHTCSADVVEKQLAEAQRLPDEKIQRAVKKKILGKKSPRK